MREQFVWGLSVWILLTLVTVPVARASAIDVTINPNGALIDHGGRALVHVGVTCTAVGEVLEAFVMVQQDRVSGQGGLFNVKCDGERHSSLARVTALDGPFIAGEAHASAFVLVCNKAGVCEQGQASKTIVLRGSS